MNKTKGEREPCKHCGKNHSWYRTERRESNLWLRIQEWLAGGFKYFPKKQSKEKE